MNIWDYVLSAYGVTAIVLLGMVLITYQRSKKGKR